MLIRRGGEVVLQFRLGEDTGVCQVPFRSLAQGASGRAIQLGFPRQISRSWFPDQRQHMRVRVSPDSGVVIKVIRPSGETFLANLFDISYGGVAFYPQKGMFTLLRGINLQLLFKITGPPSIMIAISGTMVGTQVKEGIACFQIRFMLDSSLGTDRLERLISLITQEKVIGTVEDHF